MKLDFAKSDGLVTGNLSRFVQQIGALAEIVQQQRRQPDARLAFEQELLRRESFPCDNSA